MQTACLPELSAKTEATVESCRCLDDSWGKRQVNRKLEGESGRGEISAGTLNVQSPGILDSQAGVRVRWVQRREKLSSPANSENLHSQLDNSIHALGERGLDGAVKFSGLLWLPFHQETE